MMAKGERYKEPIALAAWARSRRSPGGMWKLGGRTARNAEPVDPVIGTPHTCHRILECELLTGTW